MKKLFTFIFITLFIFQINTIFAEERTTKCPICDSYSQTGAHYCNHTTPSNPTTPDEDDDEDITPTYYCSHCGTTVSYSGEICDECLYQIELDYNLNEIKDELKVIGALINTVIDTTAKNKEELLQLMTSLTATTNDKEEVAFSLFEKTREKREREQQAKEETIKQELEEESVVAGDPVRITNGEFVQEETDFTTNSFSVNRTYTTYNSTVGSFGESFSTVLDEGLIFGLDLQVDSKIEIKQNAIKEYEKLKGNLNQNLIDEFGTTEKETIFEEINQLVKERESLYETTKKTYLESKDLLNKAKGRKQYSKAQSQYKEAEELYEEIEDAKNTAENIKTKTTEIFALLSELENNIATEKEDLIQLYKDKEKTEKLLQENTRRNFTNLPENFYNSGLDTLTLIEGNSGIKRFTLSTNTNQEDVWFLLNQDNTVNKKEKIIKSENGYLYFQKNGETKTYNQAGFLISITDINGNKTEFIRNQQNQIEKITTKENQEYKFFYGNSGLITKIQNVNTNKEYNYFYQGEKLVKVISPEKLEYQYIYNQENGLLTKFIKPDGSFTAYYHEEKDKNQKILTTSTENEEGYKEKFDFYPEEKITLYTNHDGEKTLYQFDENGKTIKVEDSKGNIQENTYNEKGNLESQNINGTLTNFFYDEEQNLTKITTTEKLETGKLQTTTETFSYDDFGNITKYVNGDGITFQYERDSKGNLTKYRINNQTLISYEYNDLGQITQKTELIDETADIYKISQYQYDDGQNLIEEKTGNTKYNYEYDSENRITKIFLNDTLETEFFYSDFSTLIKENNGLETLLKYNSRFDLIEKTETDTILNQTHTTTYTYDARHLLVEENTELKHNNFIKSQARYSASGLQEGILIFSKDSKQGFYRIYKTKGNIQNNIEGTFDLEKFQNHFPELLEKSFYKWTDEELNILIDFSESKKESSQEYIAKENAVRIIDPLNREILYKYNAKNQLESMTNFGLSQNSDFQKISYSYTKSGLLESSTNQFGGKISYEFDDFGTPKQIENQYGKNILSYTKSGLPKKVIDGEGFETTYTYNSQGLVESIKSYNKSVFYSYDDQNRIVLEIYGETPDKESALAFTEYEYSPDYRKVFVNQGNAIFTEIQLDGFGNLIAEINGEGNTKKYEYNEINQLVSFFDGYENKTEYFYNPLGNVEKVIFPDGSFEKYTYNESGLLTKVENPLGISACYEYDAGNRLVKEKTLAQEEKIYNYDSFDRLISVKTGGIVTEQYEYIDNGKIVIFKDGNTQEKKLTQNLDNFGNLQEETNSLGITQKYSYNKNGEFASKTDGNNQVKSITKISNPFGYEEITQYSDSTKKILTYDKVGRIIKEESFHSKTEYKYNQGNLLISQTDLPTNVTTLYTYDKAGRKIKVTNTKQKVEYQFGKNNEILSITDFQNNAKVNFGYDSLGREISKSYENGNKEHTSYDKAGRVLYRYLENPEKKVLQAEGYYYNSQGYITGKINHQGQITLFDYDSLGRLRVVYSTPTVDLENSQKSEVKENGGKIVENQDLKSMRKYLDYEEVFALQSLLNNFQKGQGKILGNIFYCNVEFYDYDNKGNRLSKETPFGKILYSYDTENRLVGTKAFGAFLEENQFYINFEYDKNGNLIKEISPQKEVFYTYNLENRIETVFIFDHLHQSKTEESYTYDTFGRRIVETVNNKSTFYYYDGFTFNPLYKTTFENGITSEYQTKSNGYEEILYRYRYIEENPTETSTKSFIYKDNSLVSLSENENVAYFSNDIQGSTKYVSDKTGFSETYNYDSFGKPIYNGDYLEYEEGINFDMLLGKNNKTDIEQNYSKLEELDDVKSEYKSSNWYQEKAENNNPASYQYHDYLSVAGYSGKSYNSNTGLNNYGFRDYSSSIGRFITQDPIRDGTNWYTLAVNNPINFVDLWGLCTANEKPKSVWENYTGTGNPYATQPKYFNQRDFSENFGEKYGNNACAATSLLNEISEFYTKLTGKTISMQDAIKAQEYAIEKGSINSKNAFVNSWEAAANDYWNSIYGQDNKEYTLGRFYYGSSDPDLIIYAEQNDSDIDPDHFTNSNGQNSDGKSTYYDCWDGEIGLLDNVNLVKDRPTRELSFKLNI